MKVANERHSKTITQRGHVQKTSVLTAGLTANVQYQRRAAACSGGLYGRFKICLGLWMKMRVSRGRSDAASSGLTLALALAATRFFFSAQSHFINPTTCLNIVIDYRRTADSRMLACGIY